MVQRLGKRRLFTSTIPSEFVRIATYPVPCSVFEPSVKQKKVLAPSGKKFGWKLLLELTMERLKGW